MAHLRTNSVISYSNSFNSAKRSSEILDTTINITSITYIEGQSRGTLLFCFCFVFSVQVAAHMQYLDSPPGGHDPYLGKL